MVFIALALVTVLLFLSGLHIYWAFDGGWGSSAVIPTKADDGPPLFAPSPFVTLIVALALLTAALIILLRVQVVFLPLPSWLIQIGTWTIAVAFVLRAIGEFRYVGFFKRVRNTHFARMDSRLYSPLCLALGLLASAVAL